MSNKSKSKSGKLKSSPSKGRSHTGSLFIVAGFVFFLAITIASLLVFQRSDNDLAVVKSPAKQTQEQARAEALEAAPANRPHPVNLGDISIDDTVIVEGAETEVVKLPPNVTLSEPQKTVTKPPSKKNPSRKQTATKNIQTEVPKPSTQERQIASLPPPDNPGEQKYVWRRPERPMIAIVLDDVGVNRTGAELAIELPSAITLSFMTYAPDVQKMTKAAQKKGHELMLHVPMEPLGSADPGPQALLTELSDEEILSRLEWGMVQFDGYIGINNHMGSKFTGWERGMQVVMQRIEKTDYFFMDSRTSPRSVAAQTASLLGVPVLERDTFIDNDYQNTHKIESQLELTEKIAIKNGHAIAIGHPHRTTVKVLHEWVKSAESRGFDIVPISKILTLKKPVE
ncbi:divergent polysaccharide deacetylase family protein [Kiloniella antarctica]|uniref:Divergent polysaccharide deacetylase family protein n=1 Tax=Kiloniella antarctica TaxID=1550907 RepID=A0ABW5BRA1_9PROT